MHIPPFATEVYFAQYEFTTPHILCASDCETLSIAELLALAGADPAELLDLRLGYTESQGNPALRAAAAALYTGVAPGDVVMLGAPEEGIYLTMRALLEPGDPVVVLTPAYDSLLNLAEHVSGRVNRWPIRPTPGGWALDLDNLERLVAPGTRLVVVNFPHNPTGYLPTLDEFDALIDIVARRGAWLLCDEMYRGLERDPVDRLPSAADRYERAIVLAGLSKTHGLPGLRAGWLIIRDPATRDALINWKHYTTICPPAPSEALAAVALRAHEPLAGRSRALIAANLERAAGFFARWPELFDWRPPRAGSVALVGLNRPSATAYCHMLAREAGVLLLPGSCLGYDDQSVRFGFGRAAFAAALAHYERHLEAGR
ncbi:aminotransferase class I/II-fold pyridoxal phosphate-dependent enzyme [Promineifilum sp.]|uniref:aminotransferase class I/II-fold pyridoxal phosphate-dependent enzyme n=1 Tax=Promineifilum sp. TaxID=2664178 RepID=UPI0035AE2C6A